MLGKITWTIIKLQLLSLWAVGRGTHGSQASQSERGDDTPARRSRAARPTPLCTEAWAAPHRLSDAGTLMGFREPPCSAGAETEPIFLSGPTGHPGRQPLDLGPPFISASAL